MRRLKADLHTHTSDDPRDEIAYSAEMLIDAAAEKGVDVLSITCHEALIFNEYLREYAARRDVLLIPAIEAEIEGKHVILLNPDEEQARAESFEELRRLGKREAAIMAPHPYYPSRTSLGRKLDEHIDLFDAIEYCNFYMRGLNFNRKAARVAAKHGLPMLGNTDTHLFPYEDSTFSWIEAEPTVASVIEAIRCGRVEVETRPREMRYIAKMVLFSMLQTTREVFKTLRDGILPK